MDYLGVGGRSAKHGQRPQLDAAGDILPQTVADHHDLIRQKIPAVEGQLEKAAIGFAVFHTGAGETEVKVGAQTKIIDRALEAAVEIVIGQQGELVACLL